MHYYRHRNTGDVGTAELRRKPARQCKVQGCGNSAITRDDLCATHRRRKRLYGHEDGTFTTHRTCPTCGLPAVPAPRSSDFCADHYVEYVKALVAAGDASIAHTSSAGYRYLSVFKQRYAEHAVVMEAMLGRGLRPGESVHHKNGQRGDNRPENLELWVTPQRAGQRVEDLVAWVVGSYPEYVKAALGQTPQTEGGAAPM